MELIDYISKDDISVDNQKTVAQTLEVFDAISYSHIPVVHEKKIIGNIAKEDLDSLDDETQKLEVLEYMYEFFFSKDDDTLLDVISNFAEHNTNILPVINKQNEYIGYLDLNDTLDYFSNTYFLNTEGNILLLEKNTKEFTMSEVCQIVEANDNQILGCFVSKKNEEHTLITLKINSININELIQSFRRYDYTIVNNLTEDSYLEGLKKRSDYFIKYLNI
ncbi:CBS domain-containing protein [Wenyingzhuangia sp. 2_MG-2023]|uniref:CBS domain-containing protein n=1 Tax=Wenyingzhuangia sp. 2_MG-2023 TaxID=3062639 RepID=UPI0026E312C7|nr:CBS domain-containing protein [Wenyingzhuangia sp. 2_MG-2023]MDO6736430.1 CBS domain-containing protein [Wenyingzhuangia sp. 2_MG-2023]MDO6801258.1 CBS domain-containing protein [Wenyingzhuangia sp. 1_MG-2023]